MADNTAWILENQQQHEKTYQKFKAYFQEKIAALGLVEPLVFFDDEALRIDIGYGRVEFEALFSKFFAPGTLLQRELHPDVGFFGGADELSHLNYLHPDYESHLKEETNSILQEYDVYSESRSFTRIRPILSLNPTESDIVEIYLESNRGFVLGESHEDMAPKKFLIENMEKFKALGVTTLYMEHLLSERHQALLDEYCASSELTQMPKELELYLAHLDLQRNLLAEASFTAVVKAAKAQKIRIVAIDTEATYNLGIVSHQSDLRDTNLFTDRYKAMNMAVVKHVRGQGDGKYIVFVGNMHVSTCEEVLGVSELLNIPNIVVQNLYKDHAQNNIDVNAKYDYDDGRSAPIYFDVLYHRSFPPIAKHADVQIMSLSSSSSDASSSLSLIPATASSVLTSTLRTHGMFRRSVIEGASSGATRKSNMCSIQ